MVVGNDVCIAVLWLVDLQVRMFPGKLLPWINGLAERRRLMFQIILLTDCVINLVLINI